jgi:hypothetical protein
MFLRPTYHSSREILPNVGASEYDHEFSTMRWPWPTGGVASWYKKCISTAIISLLKHISYSSFYPPVFIPRLLNFYRLDIFVDLKVCW